MCSAPPAASESSAMELSVQTMVGQWCEGSTARPSWCGETGGQEWGGPGQGAVLGRRSRRWWGKLPRGCEWGLRMTECKREERLGPGHLGLG